MHQERLIDLINEHLKSNEKITSHKQDYDSADVSSKLINYISVFQYNEKDVFTSGKSSSIGNKYIGLEVSPAENSISKEDGSKSLFPKEHLKKN